MEHHVKERLVGAAVLMAAAVILIPEMLSGPDREFSEFADDVPNGPPLTTYTIDLSQPAGAANPADRPEDRAAPPAQAAMDLQPRTPQPAHSAPESAASKPEASRTTSSSSTPAAQAPVGRSPGQDPAPSRAAPASTVASSAPPAANVVEPTTPPRASPSPSRPAPQVGVKPSVPSSGAWAVQIGSYSRRDSAESQAARLRGAGHSAFVMPVRTEAGTFHRVRVGPMKDRAGAEAALRVLRTLAPDAAVVSHP